MRYLFEYSVLNMSRIICLWLLSCFIDSITAECWNQTLSPQYDDHRWVIGIDGQDSADDISLLTDNHILKSKYPNECGGTYGCDVVFYKIQWFPGYWSAFYPGVNDVDWKTNSNGYERRVWSYFHDHNHTFTFCN